MPHIPARFWRIMPIGAALLAGSVTIAGAAPSPRVVVERDGMSVVLVAAEQRIHAYVDRIADNAPVSDATLGLELRGSAVRVPLQQVSPGLFVAPFQPSRQDVFQITLERSGGPRSQAIAALARDEPSAATPADPVESSRPGRLPWLLIGLASLVALLLNRFGRQSVGGSRWVGMQADR